MSGDGPPVETCSNRKAKEPSSNDVAYSEGKRSRVVPHHDPFRLSRRTTRATPLDECRHALLPAGRLDGSSSLLLIRSVSPIRLPSPTFYFSFMGKAFGSRTLPRRAGTHHKGVMLPMMADRIFDRLPRSFVVSNCCFERGTPMKTPLLASAFTLAIASVSPVFANAGPPTFGPGALQERTAQPAARSRHWEWQYGYVGHHASYAPHWVLVW